MLAGRSAPWLEDTCCAWVFSSLLLSAAGAGTPGKQQSPRESVSEVRQSHPDPHQAGACPLDTEDCGQSGGPCVQKNL